MDFNKIGNFIMTERKAKNLTQAKLAEKLFVSEKTVSKWENGKGLPDTSILPQLCEILQVSVNELLNGEKLEGESYINKAEEKLLELQKTKEESDKRLLKMEFFIAGISVVSFLTMLFSACFLFEQTSLVALPIILIVLSIAVLMVGIIVCLYIEQKAGYYVCKKCEHKHVPTFSQVLFACHINRTRYMKCPHCKKRSWHKKVTK